MRAWIIAACIVCVALVAWLRKSIANELSPWQAELARAERRVTSQAHQDGIIEAIFASIGTTNQYYCEFGFNSDSYEGGSGANTLQLHNRGWRGLLMDGGHENVSINLRRESFGPHGIVRLLQKHGVPLELDYLSIDFDSFDLWTFRSVIVGSPFRPRVVSVEYNVLYPFDSTLALGFPAADGYLNKTGAGAVTGASLGALDRVAREGGYTLVYVVTGLDAFFVRTQRACMYILWRERRAASGAPRGPESALADVAAGL